MRVLITGTAGFIGYHLAESLLADGAEVFGFDNHNDYYDPAIKRARVKRLRQYDHYHHAVGDLVDRKAVESVVARAAPAVAVHLAAQAGVRYSLENPMAYVDSNITGFLNVLEVCKSVPHVLYASSSSVYGYNDAQPFSESQPTEQPASLYAVTKKANEQMAYAYSRLFGMKTTGMRFFTAYGPWGRPDMALFKFTKAILAGDPVQLFNGGNHARDFTFISDIVQGIRLLMDRPGPMADVYNIGCGNPRPLMEFLTEIESQLGHKASIDYLPLQAGDVPSTAADISKLQALGYAPQVQIQEGIGQFVRWYQEYYG